MSRQIQSVERGLYILEAIAFGDEPVTGIELARTLGVHKSTISHLATTLVEAGYLAKQPGSSKLRRGPKLYRIARSVGLSGEKLPEMPVTLRGLTDVTGETSHLAELRGRYVVYLLNQYPRKALRVQTESGSVEAAHSTAVGKAILSCLPEDEVRSLFEGVAMERYTERTLTTIEELLEDLARARDLGYATDRGEQTPGIGCLAAPVRDATSMVVAAVGVSGPESRVFAGGSGPGEEVLACASSVERALGD